CPRFHPPRTRPETGHLQRGSRCSVPGSWAGRMPARTPPCPRSRSPRSSPTARTGPSRSPPSSIRSGQPTSIACCGTIRSRRSTSACRL
ncbi:MAG: hypothetical protein AVDCRST_MAG87-2443, partial [uncultured Thermomicrobiales bacterium]